MLFEHSTQSCCGCSRESGHGRDGSTSTCRASGIVPLLTKWPCSWLMHRPNYSDTPSEQRAMRISSTILERSRKLCCSWTVLGLLNFTQNLPVLLLHCRAELSPGQRRGRSTSSLPADQRWGPRRSLPPGVFLAALS